MLFKKKLFLFVFPKSDFNITYKGVFECGRKVRMEEHLQHQQQLQDAAFGVQTQHEAAIEETGALYNKLMALHTAAHHHLVRRLK